MDTQFYTYLHCRPNGSPFYVGKGKLYRAGEFANRSIHHKNIVSKYGKENIIILKLKKDSEESAFKSEIRLIKILRNAGFELCNKTNGGEGISGCPRTLEWRKKLSISIKKTLSTPEHKKRIQETMHGNKLALGLKHSIETKEKMSKSRIGNKHKLGKKVSIETRKKLSLAAKKDWEKRKFSLTKGEI